MKGSADVWRNRPLLEFITAGVARTTRPAAADVRAQRRARGPVFVPRPHAPLAGLARGVLATGGVGQPAAGESRTALHRLDLAGDRRGRRLGQLRGAAD